MSRKLYNYFRSSAAWRVRIALAWKGLDYETVSIHLLRDGGQQHSEVFRALNPQGLVPALVDDGAVLTQSLAICEYLEERYPYPPLLPGNAIERAQVRASALSIACDIHPINNLRVIQYLKNTLGHDQQQVDDWYRHWIRLGFEALETRLANNGANLFCHGDAVTLADICLVPQMFNARRLQLDLQAFPTLCRIDAHLNTLHAFSETHPSKQADAE
ncbi:maleylacetoacetate isomerase [Chitinimonas lacunae]|uniref:Maleylacetoacetate isomerase n=1 Tax=Chitinimonas lacunae TaxID=1963018 RepID=A0ABV8MLU1_9NEIS